jgi:hypothetical protein
VAAQPRSQLYTTYVNQAEILCGIGDPPEWRRTALAAAAELTGRIAQSRLGDPAEPIRNFTKTWAKSRTAI